MSSLTPNTRIQILEAAWKLLERQPSQAVRMSDIAAATGISRQAVYLHFASRTDLMVATARYVDEVKGVGERLRRWHATTDGLELLESYIVFWGNYVPEIYAVAKALLATIDADEAAAAAWNDRMADVKNGCRITVQALKRDGLLAPGWTVDTATDLFWALLSVNTWAMLTRECGWSVAQYIRHIHRCAARTFVARADA